MKYRTLILCLTIFTALSTLLYWILVCANIFPLTEIVPGYLVWFNSFPLADLWIVITSVFLAVAIKIDRKCLIIISGLLTASAMIYFVLNALLFGINTGTIFMTGMGTFLKIYRLFVGIFFIKQFSEQVYILYKNNNQGCLYVAP